MEEENETGKRKMKKETLHCENEPLLLCREAGEGWAVWADAGILIGLFLLCRSIGILLGHLFAFAPADFFRSSDWAYLFIRFLSDGIGIGIVLSFAQRFQKRGVKSFGFLKEKWFLRAAGSLAAGMLAFSLPLFAGWAAGAVRLEGAPLQAMPGQIALFFGAILLNAFFEETLFTGFFAVSAARRIPSLCASAIAAVFSAVPSLFRGGAGVISTVNLILFSFLLGAFFFAVKGSLWGIGCFHAGWIFAEGCLFGMPVRGWGRLPSVWIFSSSSSLFSGGVFGPEGGLSVTLLLLLGICGVFLLDRKKKKRLDLSAF